MALKTVDDLVYDINASPTKAVIIATGGGTEIFPCLLRRGGGSATLLAGLVPYSNKETEKILGRSPEKLVSRETARSLAMAAYQRAVELRDGDYPVIGVACTASLQRVPDERAGRVHSICVALQTKDFTHEACLNVEDARLVFGTHDTISTREVEEDFCMRLLLNELAIGMDIEHHVMLQILDDGFIEYDSFKSETFGNLLDKSIKYAFFQGATKVTEPDGNWRVETAIFPGSFNPVHDGHYEMMEIVREYRNKICYPEISLTNVDKPAIDFISLRDRLLKLSPWPVIVTNSPTFVQKSNLFPDASFIVGYDTYERILNPKYSGSIEHVCSMFSGNRNHFFIFPRADKKAVGIWGTEHTVIPGEFMKETRRFAHVSSTDIRRKGNG